MPTFVAAAAWDLPIHLVVSERNDPRLQRMELLWRWLRCLCYRRADVVTANTEGVLEALQEMGAWQRLELLPNPLPAGVLHEDADPAHGIETEILAVARLVPQKGLDLLLRAFAELDLSCRAGWRVTLVGDGPEREALEWQVQHLAIVDSVVLRASAQTLSPSCSVPRSLLCPPVSRGCPMRCWRPWLLDSPRW